MAPTQATPTRPRRRTGYLPAGVGVFLGTAGVLCGVTVFLFPFAFLLGLGGLMSGLAGLNLADADPAREHRRFAITAVSLSLAAIALAIVEAGVFMHTGWD